MLSTLFIATLLYRKMYGKVIRDYISSGGPSRRSQSRGVQKEKDPEQNNNGVTSVINLPPLLKVSSDDDVFRIDDLLASITISKPAEKTVREPIWKRRGAKPIPKLKLDSIIISDGWVEHAAETLSQMKIVESKEWVIKKDYFEAHPFSDIEEGVVINPQVFSAWSMISSSGMVVPVQLPYCFDLLFERARLYGYLTNTLISRMAGPAGYYAMMLIHPKKRHRDEVLILARPKIWQGIAALKAATFLLSTKIKVTVYIHDDGRNINATVTQEEKEFIRAGGTVHRNLRALKGKIFRVVIVAVENQAMSGSHTILPLFSEWLEHSLIVFVDPPTLHCSYSHCLQAITHGNFNLSNRSVILVPAIPKVYAADSFVDVYVVDVGFIKEVYSACGMEPFPHVKENGPELMIPLKFTPKGSKIYFYSDYKLVSQ